MLVLPGLSTWFSCMISVAASLWLLMAPAIGADRYAAAARLGAGINLGNALEAPQEGDWGVVLEAADFAKVAAVGFQHIRLPVRWSAHAETSPPYTIEPAFFDRVDWAIDQALRHGLAVVLNVHHYEEMILDPPSHRPRLLALWQQIAGHYADLPETVYFEILNEPKHALDAVWSDVLVENLAVIRASNPTRPVIVGPPNNNGVYHIADLTLPDDPMLIVGVHYYSPVELTHQGAGWIDDAKDWLGTRWQGSARERRILRQDFDRAERWAKANNVPLYLGEFGTINQADMASRVRWTAFVRSEASRRGWPWAYWEFRSTFGAYDAKSGAWNDLLAALLPAPARR